jgi:uridine phosphorylase
VRSHDSLYTDLHASLMPRRVELAEALQVWHRSRVLCNDMETSAIFIICALRGLRGGSILTVVNEPGETDIDPKRVAALDLAPMFRVALAAVQSLAAVKA